jgi:hypothetical protein
VVAVNEWTKVVTDPLGLVGFALFLVFAYLARVKKSKQHRWIVPSAMIMASVALVGGLTLAYYRVHAAAKPSAQPSPAPVKQRSVQQKSSGPGSPNVQGVEGDVTITVDQSSGDIKSETKAPPQKKQKQASQ